MATGATGAEGATACTFGAEADGPGRGEGLATRTIGFLRVALTSTGRILIAGVVTLTDELPADGGGAVLAAAGPGVVAGKVPGAAGVDVTGTPGGIDAGAAGPLVGEPGAASAGCCGHCWFPCAGELCAVATAGQVRHVVATATRSGPRSARKTGLTSRKERLVLDQFEPRGLRLAQRGSAGDDVRRRSRDRRGGMMPSRDAGRRRRDDRSIRRGRGDRDYAVQYHHTRA